MKLWMLVLLSSLKATAEPTSYIIYSTTSVSKKMEEEREGNMYR